ncbi:hypothetical protein F4780DRAFT_796879 [Xylariomycetidae sp. FL0641]|nr:hypothetical protein F4780DRAFT_796879 [Xylariomycetidae sp. FL0641]
MATTMMQYVLLAGCSLVALVLWHQLYPKPYPGIPYVRAPANSVTGDLPHVVSVARATDDVTNAMFAVSTKKLREPVSQLLFPNFRKPLIAARVSGDWSFDVHDDFKNLTLDVIWAALIGLDHRARISGDAIEQHEPPSAFVKVEVAYISEAISRNSKTPMPTWAREIETYKPHYRNFRRTVTEKITQTMKEAVERYRCPELGVLEAEDSDTCMMDLVLRRQILEARKAQAVPSDATQDQRMLDEFFIMLGHDSTASAHGAEG